MFTLVVLIHLLHIGIIRKECNNIFIDIIIYFTDAFSDLYLFVGHRGLKSQNKIFEIFSEVCVVY